MLAGVLGGWDDGLAAGPALLLVGYTVSLTPGGQPLSRSAPLVAAGLLAVIDLGSWSLELRDGAEERPFAHLRMLVLLAAGAFAASGVVLNIAGVAAGGGLAVWVLGVAAAVGLFTLVSHRTTSLPTTRESPK